MKLSKTLLSAMLVGIAVQTLPSCKKDNATPTYRQKMEAIRTHLHPTNYPNNCPGCGLG